MGEGSAPTDTETEAPLARWTTRQLLQEVVRRHPRNDVGFAAAVALSGTMDGLDEPAAWASENTKGE